MTPLIQKLYWKCPCFVKNRLASINARKLERQRYGRDYEQIISEIKQRDKWSAEQFAEYQCRQLQSLIQLAAANVPYYRKVFAEAGIDPVTIKEPKDLQRLPVLEKETVRTRPRDLLDESLDPRKLLIAHTSGTTGTPLILYRDLWLNCAAFAYWDARCRSVAGMQRRGNRSVDLGGHLVTAPHRSKPPFWVVNRRWNQLYMSSYHLSPKYLSSYIDELRRFKADFIEGIPSSVYALARHILENNLEPVTFKACFTTAETLFDYQRDAIAQTFECKTYNQYGCAEMAVFAAECGHGSMHLSPDYAIVEVVDDNGQQVDAGQSGQLVCTSLINRTQLFIRYRLGDVGSVKQGRCSCGRVLPMLGSLEGRIDDVLITRDGRRIGRLDPVFKGTRGIVEAQIVQYDYDKFRVRVVPSKYYRHQDGEEIKANLSARVGQGTVEIELVESIERTSGGKFRVVVRKMSDQIKN